MRIAFIGHKRIPSREGGIEIVVDELATRMAARGEQVVVYNRKGHNVAGEEFDLSLIHIFSMSEVENISPDDLKVDFPLVIVGARTTWGIVDHVTPDRCV